jgi:hypothetical protein
MVVEPTHPQCRLPSPKIEFAIDALAALGQIGPRRVAGCSIFSEDKIITNRNGTADPNTPGFRTVPNSKESRRLSGKLG